MYTNEGVPGGVTVVPASVLEVDVLPARMAEYRPADLDALVRTLAALPPPPPPAFLRTRAM